MRAEVKKTSTYESSRGDAIALGCMDFDSPQGPVHSHDGPGILVGTIARTGLPETIVVTVYTEPQPGESGHGLTCQLTPDFARTVAASLLRLADQIGGPATRQ